MGKISSFAFIFFFTVSSVAQGLKSPPHLDLEASSEELAQLLEQQKKIFSSESEQALRKVLRAGQRNLEWLKFINSHRQVPIELYEKGGSNGYPIEKPVRYSKRSILAKFSHTKSALPKVMASVIFENADFTKEPPLPIATYRQHARALDLSYQNAARWLLMEPYLDWLTHERRRDVRGYYHLSQIEDLKNHLDQYENHTPDVKENIKEWLITLCYNDRLETWKSCSQEFEASKTDLYGMSQKYWETAELNYLSFFHIPEGVKNSATHLKGRDLVSTFVLPTSLKVKSFLKKNIEEEWQDQGLKLFVEFNESPLIPRVLVEWIPNVTPHVKGLGSNHVVMDANSSLDDWDVRWTIRHEFGHVLGFPDCYLEFYEPETKEIISYQIDVDDLMCSRRGVYQPRMTEELLRVYN